MRLVSAITVMTMALPVLAQTAVPPSPATLDTLGLTTEWINAVPLNGVVDGIATVQVAGPRQVFVQTKGGLLVAFDAATGERQWSFHYETSDRTPFAVAWNDRYVFAYSIVKLYAIQRLTGILDFTQNLPLVPVAGPMADATTVYCVMAGNRIAAYELPAGLAMPDPKLVKAAAAAGPNAKSLPNPADVVAQRYPAKSRNMNFGEDQFDQTRIRLTAEPAGSFGTTQRTASMAIVAHLRPPYSAFDANGHYLVQSPSLNTVSSLRQPYHLIDDTRKNAQRTPSISAIPPSLASLHESTSLRMRGIEMKMRWIYGSTVSLAYQPLESRNRIWGFSNTPHVFSLTLDQGKTQIDGRLTAELTAQPGQAEDIGYFPQADGYLVAVELDGGIGQGIRTLWKANVGGLMNAQPVPTKAAVYQAGVNGGIARVDRATGETNWRTELNSDRLLAVNDEHLYARDSYGTVYVYDRNRVNDVATKRAYPMASAAMNGFSFNVVNDVTDRVFLVGDNGLFVCLRDSNPKYAAPMVMAPVKTLPPLKKAEIPGLVKP